MPQTGWRSDRLDLEATLAGALEGMRVSTELSTRSSPERGPETQKSWRYPSSEDVQARGNRIRMRAHLGCPAGGQDHKEQSRDHAKQAATASGTPEGDQRDQPSWAPMGGAAQAAGRQIS
ncbi:uncharacterized protein LOC116759315 isoform X2 [Phocoena sinus]|uniref:uncharacterized protein LOC116759315 isoform X2 n=1 Tax=Phocoena sinus TaxID=42100 RepID=UPI0013C4FDBE|nr:uncharacterized protein LOC116759315 isoform X2 [Phocoena sinus]